MAKPEKRYYARRVGWLLDEALRALAQAEPLDLDEAADLGRRVAELAWQVRRKLEVPPTVLRVVSK